MMAPEESPLLGRLLLSTGGIIAGMLLYSILAYGIGGQQNGLVLRTAGLTLSKVASVYVYFGSALLASRGRFVLLGAGGLTAVAVALSLVSTRNSMATGMELSMLLAGGGLLGYQLGSGRSGLSAYMVGLSAVLLASVFWIVPQYSQFHDGMVAMGNESIENMKTLGVGFGGEKPTEAMLVEMRQIIKFLARILPSMLILSFVTQYSAAALLFLSYKDKTSARPPLLAPFSRWQIPFPVMILLPIGVGAGFLGDGWPKLAGDNLLLMLLIFYAVGGLSLLAFYLEKIKMSRLGKVVIYLLMIPTGLFGYVALGLAGVFDSFFDWRRLYRPDEKLEKPVV